MLVDTVIVENVLPEAELGDTPADELPGASLLAAGRLEFSDGPSGPREDEAGKGDDPEGDPGGEPEDDPGTADELGPVEVLEP